MGKPPPQNFLELLRILPSIQRSAFLADSMRVSTKSESECLTPPAGLKTMTMVAMETKFVSQDSILDKLSEKYYLSRFLEGEQGFYFVPPPPPLPAVAPKKPALDRVKEVPTAVNILQTDAEELSGFTNRAYNRRRRQRVVCEV